MIAENGGISIEINWKDQCKWCSKSLNTTYCNMNQRFIEKLADVEDKENYKGNIEFQCQYFCFDDYLYKKNEK